MNGYITAAVRQIAKVLGQEDATRNPLRPLNWHTGPSSALLAKSLHQFVKQEKGRIEEMVFRNGEDFVAFGVSLLIQLINQHRGTSRQEFLTFYSSCVALRAHLCTSPREIEDDLSFAPLKDVFDQFPERTDGPWTGLMRFIHDRPTSEVFDLRNQMLSPVFLTAYGAYKRLRTLNHVLRRQRSPASLAWELGRFDLLGAQLNCLLKSEAFCVYEEVWSRGDPFLRTKKGASTDKDFHQRPRESLSSRSRSRWLCLRTNIHSKSYRALQVAALMDLESFTPGYWDRPSLNLNRLRVILAALCGKYCNKWLKQYKGMAFHRRRIAVAYEEWNRLASAIGPSRSAFAASGLHISHLLPGVFLFQGVIDVLIYLTGGAHDSTPPLREDYRDHLRVAICNILAKVVKHCGVARQYTDKFLNECTTTGDNWLSQGETSFKGWPRRYQEVMALLRELKKKAHSDNEDDRRMRQFCERIIQNLKKEQTLFEETFAIGGKNGSKKGEATSDAALWSRLRALPVMYIPTLDPREYKQRIAEYRARIIAFRVSPTKDAGFPRWARRMLQKLRQVQKSYLMDEEYLRFSGAGESMRSTNDVLGRIINLVFLYDYDDVMASMEQSGEGTDGPESSVLEAITPYDLFYYVRSLIPFEVQVRTKLADTIAERYHDAVYKGEPPEGTEIERSELAEMAGQADDVDRELEIDYEDYVTKYYFNRLDWKGGYGSPPKAK